MSRPCSSRSGSDRGCGRPLRRHVGASCDPHPRRHRPRVSVDRRARGGARPPPGRPRAGRGDGTRTHPGVRGRGRHCAVGHAWSAPGARQRPRRRGSDGVVSGVGSACVTRCGCPGAGAARHSRRSCPSLVGVVRGRSGAVAPPTERGTQPLLDGRRDSGCSLIAAARSCLAGSLRRGHARRARRRGPGWSSRWLFDGSRAESVARSRPPTLVRGRRRRHVVDAARAAGVGGRVPQGAPGRHRVRARRTRAGVRARDRDRAPAAGLISERG